MLSLLAACWCFMKKKSSFTTVKIVVVITSFRPNPEKNPSQHWIKVLEVLASTITSSSSDIEGGNMKDGIPCNRTEQNRIVIAVVSQHH